MIRCPRNLVPGRQQGNHVAKSSVLQPHPVYKPHASTKEYLAIENANNSYQVAQLRKVGRHYVILGTDDKHKGDQTEVHTVAFMAP